MMHEIVATYNQPMFGCPMYLVHRMTLVDFFVTGCEAKVTAGEQTRMVLPGIEKDFFVNLPISRPAGEMPDKLRLVGGDKFVRNLEKTFQALYGRSKGYRDKKLVDWFFVEVCWDDCRESSVYDIGVRMMSWVLDVLSLPCKLLEYPALFGKRVHPDPNDWLVDLCLKLGASKFVNGQKAIEKYMTLEKFTQKGIEVVPQRYVMPEYVVNGRSMSSLVSVVDPIFRVGPDETRRLLGLDGDDFV